MQHYQMFLNSSVIFRCILVPLLSVPACRPSSSETIILCWSRWCLVLLGDIKTHASPPRHGECSYHGVSERGVVFAQLVLYKVDCSVRSCIGVNFGTSLVTDPAQTMENPPRTFLRAGVAR